MKRAAVALCIALPLAGCGSRTGPLVGSDVEAGPGVTEEIPTELLTFPSIEEASAVPEPAPRPDLRPREEGFVGLRRECELSAPSLDTVLARIQADVMARPGEDRPFLRYLSAAFLFPSYCRVDTAVNVVADVMPLLLNSLSLTESAASAQPVGGDEALLRIDLREMGWQRPIRVGEQEHRDGWEALSANAAQSIALRGPEADALSQELGTRTPLLHAHDLARAALGAGVYYALLDAPETLGELRSALGIPAELEDEPNAYWRAVTTQSVVSRQDRVVLRYRGPLDSPLFWHTLDRRPDTASSSTLVDPLAREGDESSVVYTLPNGLPAYFLADSDGRRLDASRVLVDVFQEDFVPRTAPSCVRCHSEGGVVRVVDELRAYAATDPNGRFDERERALLAEVYPPQEELDALIQADQRRVAEAQARLAIPRAGGGPPLNELVLDSTQDLLPELAAAELFVSPEELERRRGELPGPLRVLTTVGSLGRQSFNEIYREALCVLTRDARNQPSSCP